MSFYPRAPPESLQLGSMPLESLRFSKSRYPTPCQYGWTSEYKIQWLDEIFLADYEELLTYDNDNKSESNSDDNYDVEPDEESEENDDDF